jgi:putative ABC transport system permease protein
MKERGAVMTLDFDDYIFVPVRTLQKKVMGIDHVMYSIHQMHDAKKADQTAEEIRTILRENHNIVSEITPDGKIDIGRDDFRVVTMEEMMDMLDIITNALTLLLIAITMVSLVVGGVGVMNIMYVIVSERTSEIGLRKAVGATANDILKNFLLESVIVTLFGAIIGIALGILASFLLYLAANQYLSDWHFAIPARAYVVTLAFSAIFGVLFGLYPARKAAKLSPVDALRIE